MHTRNRKTEDRRKHPVPARSPSSEDSFTFRISGFTQASAFGLRMLVLQAYVCSSFLAAAAETNSASELPASSLRPPRGELPASFWEQYGIWIILASLLLLCWIALAVWLIVRPKAAPPVPRAVSARQELEPLRSLPEDGHLLSRASQVLRHYLVAALGLPAQELTTAEFCAVVLNHPKIGAELGEQICGFLRDCDLRKFSPVATGPQLGAVDRILNLVDRCENRLTELDRLASAQAIHDGKDSSPGAGQPQRQPSGA